MPFGLSNASSRFYGYINKISVKKLVIFVGVNLDNILFYTEDLDQSKIKIVWWVLDVLHKHEIYINLNKYRFYKNKIHFLSYVLSVYGVKTEDKQIKVIKSWLESKSVQDIQVFISFTNFH